GTEPYQSTCQRQVVDHTETRCHQVSGQSCSAGSEVCSTTADSVCNSQGCTSVPRRSCHTGSQSCHSVSREVCGNENVYRSQSYACTRTRQVPIGQTLTKTFNHTVEVELTPALIAVIADQTLSIGLAANESAVTPSVATPFPSALLTYDVKQTGVTNSESVQNSQEVFTLDYGMPGDIARKMESVTAQNLELGSDSFRFDLTNGAGLEKYLLFGIKLVKTPAVWFPNTVFEGDLKSSSLALASVGTNLKVLVPYESLQLGSIGGRYSLDVSIKLDSSKVLNISDFEASLQKNLSLSLTKERPTY
ncbi:MAG: hypothetical protein H7333_04070, partial [Bdellovibrionales bacterium]|nr:hypothetical protein [Oligoflexia bacterium]